MDIIRCAKYLYKLLATVKSNVFSKSKNNVDDAVESKTLMEEEPYAAIVKDKFLPYTCSKCFAWNRINKPERVPLAPCPGCNVLYYCSQNCQKADWDDHEAECAFLCSLDGSFVPEAKARLACRMIMKSKSQPEWKAFNGRNYDRLLDHCESQRKDIDFMSDLWETYAELQELMGIETPDFEACFLVLSKILINSFSVNDGSHLNTSRGIAVYIGLSVLNHSCRPDAFVVFQGSKIMLRTTNMEISYSDDLTISYTNCFTKDTESRRAYFQNKYFFTCMCDECMDTDKDSMRTSGRPTCCPDGWFSLADLRCSMCGNAVPSSLGKMAKEANQKLGKVLSECGDQDAKLVITEWMDIFDDCKKVLSDENVFLLGLADEISGFAPNLKIALEFADICLPYVRKQPYDYSRSICLCYRYSVCNYMNESFEDTRKALEEALETVKVVFGMNHELTREFLKKQHEYNTFVRLAKI